MADSDVNLKALQRVDPYIVEILDSATQVALYKFNSNDNEWDKTGVEGTLFVYRRSAPPYNGFIIMNRLSKTNQVEPITKDLELQREDPYLLYRNSKLNIFGIWFYDRKESAKISESTTRLLQKEKERSRGIQRVRHTSESDITHKEPQPGTMSMDILSLLSKAQEVYVKAVKDATKSQSSEPKKIIASPTSGNTSTAELIRPKAVRIGGAPDVTRTSPITKHSDIQEESLTVEELFASATKGSSGTVGGNSAILDALVASEVISPPPQPPTSSQYHPDNSTTAPSNPVLLRLMSNPEHLVEHIERRQRNEFPSPLSTPLTAKSLEKDLKETLKLVMSTNGGTEVKLIDTSTDQSTGDAGSNLKSSASMSVPPVLTPAMLESSLPGLPTTPTNGGINVSSSSSQSPHNVVTPSMFAKLAKPPLMSPMMFLAGMSPAASGKDSTEGQLNPNDSKIVSADEIRHKDVEYLTKSQLVQALVYMLKNDSEFVKKLHEAYVKSLVELTSHRKS